MPQWPDRLRQRTGALVLVGSLSPPSGRYAAQAHVDRQPWALILLVDHDHGPVVARAELALHDAARGARRDRFGSKHVVQPPADVALAHLAPGRPPGEQALVVRVEHALHVDQVLAEQLLEERAFLGQLAADVFALGRADVARGAGDVDVAAEAQLLDLGV